MIHTTNELAALLRGTALEGAALSYRVRFARDPAALLGIDPGPDVDRIDAWRQLRTGTGTGTGRHPVVLSRLQADAYRVEQRIDGAPPPAPPMRLFSPRPDGTLGLGDVVAVPDSRPPDDPAPGLIAAVDSVDPSAVVAAYADGSARALDWLDVDDPRSWHHPLESTLRRWDTAPTLHELRQLAAQGTIRNGVELERWLFDWELRRFGTAALAPGDPSSRTHIDWHDGFLEDAPLVLLPTDRSWTSLAYCDWYGAWNGGPQRPMHFLRRWQERFGAELVCSFGTVLQLLVVRRPANAEQAFELAVEQAAIASDTLDLPGVSLRDHARALMNTDRWLLHSRP